MNNFHNTPLAILESELEIFLQMDFQSLVEGKPERIGVFTQKIGNIALINISGPILSDANWFSSFFGLANTAGLQSDFIDAENDDSIDTIIFNIDSPGGQVTGINEFASIISNSEKRTIAYIRGTGASAAYWIASGSDEIYADSTARIGSIGVVIGMRKKDDKAIEIMNTASPKKRIDPETDEGKADLLRQADGIADIFIDFVAAQRETTREDVIENYGKGSVLIGNDAVSVGMIDGISSLNTIIENNVNIQGGYNMDKITTVVQLAAAYPDLVQAIRDEENKKAAKAMNDAQKEGETLEKTRILGLAKVQFPNDFEAFNKVVESGVTPEQFQAIAGTIKPKNDDFKADMLNEIKKTGAVDVGTVTTASNVIDIEAEIRKQKDNGKNQLQAITEVRKMYPDKYDEYLKKQQGGA